MKHLTVALSALLVLLILSACTINHPIAATSNPLGTKVGVYSQSTVFGFPPPMNSKAAILEAARNGGITKISTVNYNISWTLFGTKYETIVTGE